MHKKRVLSIQTLEHRRVLAAVTEPTLHVAADIAEPTGADSSQLSVDFDSVALPRIGVFPANGPDLVQEIDSKVYVVDQDPGVSRSGALHVFERSNDGTLVSIAEVELSFRVAQMQIVADQIVLIGRAASPTFHFPSLVTLQAEHRNVATTNDFSRYGPSTMMATVSLGDGVSVVEQEYRGYFQDAYVHEDRLLLITSNTGDAVIAIYPPPPASSTARLIEITPTGFHQATAVQIPGGHISQLIGDDLYVASTDQSDVLYFELVTPDFDPADLTPDVSIHRYRLGEDSIELIADRLIDRGYLNSFDVADDGLTAVLVRANHRREGSSFVDLLDLSADDIRVFDSIKLTDTSPYTIGSNANHVVLGAYDPGNLIVIDTNQSIDLAAENRVRRIAIPEGFQLYGSHLQVNDELLMVSGFRKPVATDQRLSGPQSTAVLLTISISEARVVGETLPRGAYIPWTPLILIDAESGRVGYVHQNNADGHESRRFVFGHLNDDGELIADGSLPIQRWIETDMNADRLIARLADRLLEYPWETNGEPIVTSLADPAIKAIDDVFRLKGIGDSHVLDVLANDRNLGDRDQVKIVRLVDAPEGSEIIREGRAIRIPATPLTVASEFRFEYVVSRGSEELSAVVEVFIVPDFEQQARRLVEAVRQRTAEDFDVPIDRVEVLRVERLFAHDHHGDSGPSPDSPAIQVHLQLPHADAVYGANFAGRIVQISVARTGNLVELGLRATNDEGKTLTRMVKGEEFWIEFYADDLRDFGKGVYAAFFDLQVPGDLIEVTGPMEFGPGFTPVRPGTFGPDQIDELGAAGSDIQHPGGQRQQVLRIRAVAVGAGDVSLQPDPADQLGAETLLRGRDRVVPVERVKYSAAEFIVLDEPETEALDANGNGEIGGSDALVVINFLGTYGSMKVADLPLLVDDRGEGQTAPEMDLQRMRRLDTNRDQAITALDALVVINSMERQTVNDALMNDEDDDARSRIVSDPAMILGADL